MRKGPRRLRPGLGGGAAAAAADGQMEGPGGGGGSGFSAVRPRGLVRRRGLLLLLLCVAAAALLGLYLAAQGATEPRKPALEQPRVVVGAQVGWGKGCSPGCRG